MRCPTMDESEIKSTTRTLLAPSTMVRARGRWKRVAEDAAFGPSFIRPVPDSVGVDAKHPTDRLQRPNGRP